MSKPSTAPHDDTYMTTTPQDQEVDACHTDTEMSQATEPTASPPPSKEAKTPPNSTPQNSTRGMIKRPRPKGLTKHSIHQPFKSPLKISTSTTTHPPTSLDTSVSTTNPRASQAKERPHRTPSLPPPPQSKTPLPKPKARPRFRSPLPRNPDQNPSSYSSQGHQKTSVGRFLEIKALESKISELQSSIRNSTMVLRHQEKKDDTPLEDLIAKWKRVSQEGAQALLEKMVEQEQVFGEAQSYNDYYGDLTSGQGGGYGTSDYGGFGSWDEDQDKDPQARLDMIKQRMDYEDTEQDLPTVSEAPPTKMQRLLAGLGVDLDTIGYNPETDSFASKED
ncbi:hypothetical protein BGZ74_002002 [Mortierella antarctica]|nr:hypothetical protein BGZ74_002002 [Mortierella antarctica]